MQQNLSNQISTLFMKCNRKTLMHINKFVKTTIITYYKNNSILTSKYTQESFQVSLNINFVKCMFMWMSSMTSSIYRLIVPLAHKNILQYKRKNMRRNWARNLMLVQMFILIFLIFSYPLLLLLLLLLLSSSSSFLYHIQTSY